MAFRSSEYLQRNELVRYQLDDVIRLPGDNQHQVKNGYKFTINDRSSSIGDGVTGAFSKLRSIWISHLHYFFPKMRKLK